jgi:hypothetical protein
MQAELVGIVILLGGFLSILASVVIWSLRNGISPMPTSPKAKKQLLLLLPDDVQGTIYELGSGWGTLLVPLARKYPDCDVVGYETSLCPYIVSRFWIWMLRLPNAKVVRRDFFSVDLREASLLVCYLYPGAMRRLKDKLLGELKPGTCVVSNTFAIPGWIPEATREVGDLYKTKVYLYRV